jgi:tetratricopeptide (TPR) repeat protein
MKKWVALALTLTLTASMSVLASAPPNPEHLTSCEKLLVMGCWRSSAYALEKLPPPNTKSSREERMIAYWTLARYAYFTQELSESRAFFVKAQKLAQWTKLHSSPESVGNWADDVIIGDIAALDLSMHDYAAALHHADKFLSSALKNHPEFDVKSVRLMRCAALIGLNRKGEAEIALREFLASLDYAGHMPGDAMPIGPTPLSPFEAVRRVATYYARERRYEEALTLLDELEPTSQRVLATTSKDDSFNLLYASRFEPADVWYEKAIIFVAQGKDDQAEPLLRAVFNVRDKEEGIKLSRVAMRLGELYTRIGKTDEADKVAARVAIPIDKLPVYVDPVGYVFRLPEYDVLE